MAVAFDAATASGEQLDDFSFNHTPVGTPRGVLVMLFASETGDQVTGITYGGVTMTEVPLSPALPAGEVSSYAYFLGASIPTGLQAVAVNMVSDAAEWSAVCITVTASNDTEVHDTSRSITTADDPSVVLTITKESFCAGVLGSGHLSVPSAGTDTTIIATTDFGVATGGVSRKTTNATADFTYGFVTPGSDDVALLAVAITEIAAANVLFAQSVM
jgi:hypothetical protein